MRGIGLMSGSSLDGIDIAYVSFEKGHTGWSLLHSVEYDMPEEIKSSLRKVLSASAGELALIESRYTSFLAGCINTFISDHNIKPDYLAIHGHTVLHYPEHAVSWQLLNGGMLSTKTNCIVVTDFRNQDMSSGGQGAPMAVLADRDLFSGFDAYVNLGGIANVSVKGEAWEAYDICPCNQVLNHFALRKNATFDKDGFIAQSGNINQELLEVMKQDDYILKKGPKSIDNQWIHDYWIPMMESYGDSAENYLRTYVEFVCDCILGSVTLAAAKIMISGGGANNIFMMDVLKAKAVKVNYEINIPGSEIINFKEAILMAYAGFLRMHKKPNFISQATGASVDTISGAVYLPPDINSGI